MTGSRACGACPPPSTRTNSPPPCSRERLAAGVVGDLVRSSVDDEQGAVQLLRELPCLLGLEQLPVLGRDQRLRRRLERPADAILDLLRRVRLAEQAREEELDEAAVVAQPEVLVVLRPALIRVVLVLPGEAGALVERLASSRVGRPDEDRALDALGMVGGEDQPALRPERVAHDRRARGRRRVQHGERVRGELPLVVGRRLQRAVGAAVAAPVERDDAEVARQVRDLPLPLPRVDDRPRRQQEDGPRPGSVDLVEDADAVALDVPGLVRIARPRLLAARC